MVERKVLTTGEIAKYCGVNFRTVIRWIQKGHLRAYKLPGRGDHRVEIFDFISFLRDFKMPVPTELQSEADLLPENAPLILIVEDEPIITDYIQSIAANMGCKTMVADDGFKAGVMLATHKPAIVTLDLGLPGLGGYEVLRFIKSSAEFSQMRILIISGKGQSEMDAAMQAGADDSLAKPFAVEELRSKLSRLLN